MEWGYDGGPRVPGILSPPPPTHRLRGRLKPFAMSEVKMFSVEIFTNFCHQTFSMCSQFNPELVLVSCGLDAAEGDSLVSNDITITSLPVSPGQVPCISGRLRSHDSSSEGVGWRENGRHSGGKYSGTSE